MHNRYRDHIFSLKLTTNNHGEVVSYRISLSADRVVKNDIDRAYSLIDKKGLVLYNFKNEILILPVLILSTTPEVDIKSINVNYIWSFDTANIDSISHQKLLPPLLIYTYLNNPISN